MAKTKKKQVKKLGSDLPRCKSCGKIPLICTCKEFEDLKK